MKKNQKPSESEFRNLKCHHLENLLDYQVDRNQESPKEQEKLDNWASTDDSWVQIVATVHFNPKLLSREILER